MGQAVGQLDKTIRPDLSKKKETYIKNIVQRVLELPLKVEFRQTVTVENLDLNKYGNIIPIGLKFAAQLHKVLNYLYAKS